MRLLIHDLSKEAFNGAFPAKIDGMKIVSDDGSIHQCIGCFGCWIKTPGTCVIKDKYQDMGEMFSKSDEIIIISKCFYGGYSPSVKNILDRSVSHSHPYFETRNGEMHHKRRYDHEIMLKVWFYGDDITSNERQTAEKLVKANSINLACKSFKVNYVLTATGIKLG